MYKDGVKIRRFLVIDVMQLILVEPDTKRLGWGVAKLVGFLQDIEVTGDKDDSRCLHITIHRPLSSTTSSRVPLLSAKFIFDDNIRCMAAKQRLTKVKKSSFFYKRNACTDRFINMLISLIVSLATFHLYSFYFA